MPIVMPNQQTRIRTVLVGLGDVHKYHAKALFHVPELQVVGAYDKDSQRRALLDAPLYFSTQNAIASEANCDAAIVAVPTPDHFAVAFKLLESGISVLLEKPATMDLDELLELYDVANIKNTTLVVALHDAFGTEVEEFINNHMRDLIDLHGEVKSVVSYYYDPYCSDEIDWGRVSSLVGSWPDSGINALSVHGRLFGPMFLADASFAYIYRDKPTEVESNVTLSYENHKDVKGRIHTSWREAREDKSTTITFRDNHRAILNHSKQTIVVLPPNSAPKVIWSNTDSAPRLVQQYINVFKNYADLFFNHLDNRSFSVSLHAVLLEALELSRRSADGH